MRTTTTGEGRAVMGRGRAMQWQRVFATSGFAEDECGDPTCPGCQSRLVRNGMVIKRILLHSMETAFAVTFRFCCNNKGACPDIKAGAASKSYTGWSPEIRNTLPAHIQLMFKFSAQHRALIDIQIIEELSFDFLNRGSFVTFAAKLGERATAHYHSLKTAFKDRLAQAKGVCARACVCVSV